MKVRRFSPERVEDRLHKAIELAIIYSKYPIIKWISREEGVVDLSGMRSERVKVRWVNGELVAEIEK